MDNSAEARRKSTPVEAHCDVHDLFVRLADGRQIVTPLWWYPTLLKASPAERGNIELMVTGIHWPDLDEDLSIRGMLDGWRYDDAVPPAQAAE